MKSIKKLEKTLNDLSWFLKIKKYSLDKEEFYKHFIEREEFDKLLQQYEEAVKEAKYYKNKYNEEKLKNKELERKNSILKIQVQNLFNLINELKNKFSSKMISLQRSFISKKNFSEEKKSNLKNLTVEKVETKSELNESENKNSLITLIEEKLKNSLNVKNCKIDCYC